MRRSSLLNGLLEQSTTSLPPVIADALRRPWDEREAFAYCSHVTQGHYENFPVGSILIPKHLRPAIHSLYAFMRIADDFSDEGRQNGDENERLSWLNTWDQMLLDCRNDTPKHPVFIALRRTLAQHDLPIEWLRDLLRAFKQDVTVRRYATYADVLDYCRYSANPVGRLILALCGYRDEERYRLSDAICTALQLANHWQDVAVDLKKDRIYLPQEDLKRFDVSEEDLHHGLATASFQKLMAHEAGLARDLFLEGRPLPERVKGRLRYELRFTWQGGFLILQKLEAAGYDVFRRRPVVTRSDWASIAYKTLLGR